MLSGCGAQPRAQTASAQACTNGTSTQDRSARGRDADQNGIRDDIDALIQTGYTQSTAQTRAAQALTHGLQTTASTDDPTVDQATAQFQKTADATYRLRLLTNQGDETSAAVRLAGATYNTVDRITNLERYEQLASGTAFTLPANATCRKP